MITQTRLKELLHYDPESGVFTWRVSRGRVRAGCPAAHKTTDGYIHVGVDGKLHLAHRLAWLYMTGARPGDQVDHRSLIRSDNRWANLRAATNTENARNSPYRSSNTSGVRGVCWNRRLQKWIAQIRVSEQTLHLGTFNSIDAARSARLAAEATHHGAFAASATH